MYLKFMNVFYFFKQSAFFMFTIHNRHVHCTTLCGLIAGSPLGETPNSVTISKQQYTHHALPSY